MLSELLVSALVFAALVKLSPRCEGTGLGRVSITALRRADNQGGVKVQPERRIQRL